MRKIAPVLGCFALLALVLAGAALGDSNGGLAPPTPKSPNAERIQDIYWLLLGISGVIFVIVEGALLLFIYRFRNRGRPRDLEGPQLHGATRLELIWTAIPILIVAGIVTFVLFKLPGINNVPSARAGNNLKVRVEGHQFYWNFVYPNGVIQVSRLRAPVRRVVELDIASPDVDHSWWIPALNGKFDAIPGKTNHTWFKARREGTYAGQCGEFCGMQHARMVASVQVLSTSAFDRWLADEAAAQEQGTSSLGQMTFRGACAPCHGLSGQGDVGPRLKDNALTADAKAIETLLRNGGVKMPAVGKGWNDRQMKALTAFLKERFAPKGATSGG
ncbi:MAG: cytochrome c oxidase subunit II [Actinomycetota bacterium]|nr:cytochrome c oxidase subunit II [Actinomycetota bacterium]